MGEGVVNRAGVRELADGLRKHDLDIGWGVERVVRSRAFFAEANIGSRVLGPVEFVVGAARALELFDPPASTLLLADWCARLGQDLFYPPNVGGWPGTRQRGKNSDAAKLFQDIGPGVVRSRVTGASSRLDFVLFP
jgi:uncharacterized protein (DUF1800 family)